MTTAGSRRAGPRPMADWSDLDVLVGLAALVFPIIYFVADLIETAQGNFSTARLVLAYIGESAIPPLRCRPLRDTTPSHWASGALRGSELCLLVCLLHKYGRLCLGCGSLELEGGHSLLWRLVHSERRHHGDRWRGLRTRLYQSRGPATLDRNDLDHRGRARCCNGWNVQWCSHCGGRPARCGVCGHGPRATPPTLTCSVIANIRSVVLLRSFTNE